MREEASKVGNLTFMSEESDPAELVGCRPDEQLLELDAPNRPAEVGRPLPIPATHARGVIVGAGAGMTGLSLVGGVALIAFALVTSFTDGADLLRGILLALGIMLVATHWGWVHVAELSARAVEKGHGRELVDRNHRWLEGIAPYSRYEVETEVEEDGSIAIFSLHYRPVLAGQGRFTFVREVQHREVHSEDEPAATITDRAERLRREAALATQRELERYLVAAEAYETSRLLEEDERERLEARRATARALSEQINANLRDPPLEE